jgi:hypothetical protein
MVLEFLKIMVLEFLKIMVHEIFKINVPKIFATLGLFNRLARQGGWGAYYRIFIPQLVTNPNY